jgi:hypothetical protein
VADHCGENVRLEASGAVDRLTDHRLNRTCANWQAAQKGGCAILSAIGTAVNRGARDDQSYFDEWRRGGPMACGDDLDSAVDAVSCVDAERDRERQTRLVSAGGREAG